MNLKDALRLKGAPRIALVGSGGKTTAMFRLARQLFPPVWVSASTHLGVDQALLGDRHIVVQSAQEIYQSIDQMRSDFSGVTVWSGHPLGDQTRVSGLDLEALGTLHEAANELSIPLIIEADGSRQLPLKAPAEHEPVIPPWVDTVVVVAGLSGLGHKLSQEWVHRPEIFAGLSGLTLGEVITPDALNRVILHSQGGLKHIPPGARRVALFNQADNPELLLVGATLARQVLATYDAALVTSFGGKDHSNLDSDLDGDVEAVYEPVAGIILAAGGSRRINQPKQLLNWRGAPLIYHVVRNALDAGLDPVVVVTGANAEGVMVALEGMPVVWAHNSEWEAGQSRSIQVGLQALPSRVGSAVFLLADQPQIPTKLIGELIKTHAQNLSPIVAPQVKEHRANPVLFDKVTFKDLFNLKGDIGGRSIFSKFGLSFVPWDDENILLDVDTIEDFQKLQDL